MLLLAGCSKDDSEGEHCRLIKTISGSYSNSDYKQSRICRYDFAYDGQERVVSLSYTGHLYIYGEGFIHAGYTYEVDYSGVNPVVTLHTETPVIITYEGEIIPYEGLPEEETLPLAFDSRGNITSISGRELWFHIHNTRLSYEAGKLSGIDESDDSYYKSAISVTWDDENLVSQTHTSGEGESAFTQSRSFRYADSGNDNSVDLNWLIMDLGLGYQNSLSRLGLIGLLGERSGKLIGSFTETDGSPVSVSYTLEDNTIRNIRWESIGDTYLYSIIY